MSPRRYDAGRRRIAAGATRDRILEATRALLVGKGDLAAFSMEAVAAKAGVSRMTVYNQFHSQPRLLEALADQVADRGGMRHLAEAFGETRPDEAVRKFVGTFVGFWASDRVLLRRLRAMGILAPSLYRKFRERDSWRHEAARNLVARLGVARGGNRPGEAEWSADFLASVTSFEMFDALSDLGWPPDAIARSLSDSVVQLWDLDGGGLGRPARRDRTSPGRGATMGRRRRPTRAG